MASHPQAAGGDVHLCMTPQPWPRTGPGAATDTKPRFDLDRHAATLPRTLLRYAIEHLDKDLRAHYLGRKQATSG